MTRPNRTTFLAAGLACALALPTLGFADTLRADPTVMVASQRVSFADLRLTSDAGVKALYRRIVTAASNVCGPEETQNLRLRAIQRECRATAVRDAVARVGNVRLAELAATRSSFSG